jgi:hypothetical protein
VSVLFRDGPAADWTLALRRVPVFLRVVIDRATDQVDALDQLDDVPAPSEAVHVYQAVPGTTWALRGDIVICVRGAGGMQQAATGRGVYEHRADVDGEQLRDTEAWRAWCRAQPEAVEIPEPAP